MLGSASWSVHAASTNGPTRIEQLQAQLQLQHSEERKLHLMVESLTHLWSESPEFAIDLADDALRLAVRLNDVSTIPLLLHQRGLCRCELGEHDGALRDFQEAYEHLTTLEREVEGAEVALDIGRIYYEDGRSSDALEWYHRALAQSEGDLRARTLSALATLHTDLGDLLHGLDYAQQALSLVEETGDDEAIGVVLASIGIIYGHLDDDQSAYEYLVRSLDCFQRTNSRYLEVRALTNLGQIHLRRGEIDKSLDYATTSLLVHEELGDPQGMAIALMTISSIYERKNEMAVSLDFCLRAYGALEESAPSSLHANCLLAIGRLHRSVEDFEGACNAMEEGLRVAREVGDVSLQVEAHDELAGIYEDLGDLHKAIRHYRDGRSMYDALAGPERQREIVALRVRFEAERGERKVARLLARLESMNGEIAEKQNDLAQLAITVVEKNELLETLRKGLFDLARRSDGSVRRGIEQLLEPLRAGTDDAGGWSSFEAQFQQVHQGFLRILADRYPDLTPTEMKVCALLRLGMPSKEIATVLHMSPRTVESHRYWIRKKLQISSARNLNAFLGGLEE